MRSLSSIMNPSASQNASYQLERKRFLEGDFQQGLNNAAAALSKDEAFMGAISRAMGLQEGDDATALAGRMAYSPNMYESAQGYTELGEGADRRRSANILMSPDADFTDTERIGAGTVQTGKYMGRDDVISEPMKNSMLETADQLARYQIDQEQITGRQQAPFNIPLDSRAVMPDGSTVDGMQSPVAPPKPVIIPQDSDAVIQNADGTTTRVQGPRSTPKKQVITLNEGQTATILNEDGTSKTIQGPSAVQDPVTLTLDEGQRGIIKNADGTVQTFDGRDRQAEAVTATVGTGQKLYIKMPDGTETVVDGPTATEKPTVTTLGPGERATLTDSAGNVLQTIEGPALPKTLTKLIVGPDEVGTLVTDDGTKVVTVEGQKSPAKPVTIKAGLDEVVKLISGDKEITLNGPRTPEQGIQVKAGVNETVAVYKDGEEVYKLTGMSEKEQLLSVSAKTGETVFIYDKAGQLLNSFKGQDAKPEPYSVSIPEGGSAHIRYADGTERTILGQPKQRKMSDNYLVVGPEKNVLAPTAKGDLELVASTVTAKGPEFIQHDPKKNLITTNPETGEPEVKIPGKISEILGPNQQSQTFDPTDNSTITLMNLMPKAETKSQQTAKKEPKPIDTRSAQSDYYKDFTNQMMAFESGDEEDIKERIAEGGSAIEGMSQMVKKNLERKTLKRLEELLQDREDTRGYATKFQQAFEETVGTDQPVKVDGIAVPSALHKILMAGVNDPRMPATLTDKQYKSVRKTYGKILKGYKYTESEIDDIIEELFD